VVVAPGVVLPPIVELPVEDPGVPTAFGPSMPGFAMLGVVPTIGGRTDAGRRAECPGRPNAVPGVAPTTASGAAGAAPAVPPGAAVWAKQTGAAASNGRRDEFPLEHPQGPLKWKKGKAASDPPQAGVPGCVR